MIVIIIVIISIHYYYCYRIILLLSSRRGHLSYVCSFHILLLNRPESVLIQSLYTYISRPRCGRRAERGCGQSNSIIMITIMIIMIIVVIVIVRITMLITMVLMILPIIRDAPGRPRCGRRAARGSRVIPVTF